MSGGAGGQAKHWAVHAPAQAKVRKRAEPNMPSIWTNS